MFTSYDPATSFTFPPSDAANLEYSILSTILGSASDSTSPNLQAQASQRSSIYGSQTSPTSPVNGAWPSEPSYRNGTSPPNSFAASGAAYAEQTLAMQPPDTSLPTTNTSASTNNYSSPSTTTSYQQSSQYSASRPSPAQIPDGQYAEYPSTSRQTPSATSPSQYNGQSTQAATDAVSPPSNSNLQVAPRSAAPPTRSSSATAVDRTQSTGTASWSGPGAEDALETSSVYKAVTKAYDYTEGYHFLMKHLPTRYVRLLLSNPYIVLTGSVRYVGGSRRTTSCVLSGHWQFLGRP